MMDKEQEPQSLDFLLAQVSRLHYQRAHELLAELGLYRGQPPLLFALWTQDGLTHGELSERLQIAPATITKMIQRMEKAGFVQRRPDQTDQRFSRVYLTQTGRDIRTRVEGVWKQMEDETFAGFNPEERIILHGTLTKIRTNLAGNTGGNIK